MTTKNQLKNQGFSFVELIVGVTISMLLMISVSLFVQNGIKSLTNQKSTLDNDIKIKDFVRNIYDNIKSFDNTFDTKSINSSGILLKINKNYDKGGWSYIGETSLNGYYCESGSENPITNHIVIKSFIPFEGQDADLFLGNNFNSGGITTNLFSGTINNTKITNILGPSDIASSGTTGFVSDTLGHSIYKFDTSDISGTIKKIAGGDVFGDEFSDGTNGTGIFLNSPTGLSFTNIGGTQYLFISDTLNDRILYQNLINYKIYKLLGRDEGIKEPTGIYYNDSEKTLYIANSGKKEILSYSSSGSFENSTTLSFSPISNISNINRLEISFLFASGTTNPTINSPTNTGSFLFSNITSGEDLFQTGTSNTGTYHFVSYMGAESTQAGCNIGEYKIISGNPVKCTNSGTGIVGTYQNKTFTLGSNYQITINDINGTNFNNTGAYYTKLNLLDGTNIIQSYYFPYFSKGDQDIFTKSDNILKTITGSLGYPTGIYSNGNNLVFNDFIKREKVTITKTGGFVSSGALNNFDFSNFPRNKYTDVTLYTPIKNHEISTNNDVLNIFINYYKNYSCYSDENQNITKEFILKKSLK